MNAHFSSAHLSDRARDIGRGTEAIVEALGELTALLEPPQEPKSDHLTAAVLEVATEMRGIRCLLVRILNEMEHNNDEKAA